MPDILIRGLSAKTLKALKARAKSNGRSLQSEAKMVLTQTVAPDKQELAKMFRTWRQRFAGRKFADSAKLIRADRQR
jgi:plasmid stability protein